MKRVLKWTGIILASLVLFILLGIGAVYALSERQFNRSYNVQVNPIAVLMEAETISYGRHVATVRACIDCHGPDLGGRVLFEDPLIGRLVTSNLTAGHGGIGATYSDADFDRAIRHGVGLNSRPLLVMPSHEYQYLSDSDLGALIAYLRSVPPVNSDLPAMTLSPLIRAFHVLHPEVTLTSAELIDHATPRPPAPEPGPTAEYGKYMATACTGCHGSGASGGPMPAAPPHFPPPSNLTPGGPLANYSEEDFFRAMRTGTTPDGRRLNPEYMPWPILGQMTDEELTAVYLHLQSLPPREYGNR